jgi:hypothetical protein
VVSDSRQALECVELSWCKGDRIKERERERERERNSGEKREEY